MRQRNVLRETIMDVVLVFLLLIFNIFHTCFSVFVVQFEQVNVTWDWEMCVNR